MIGNSVSKQNVDFGADIGLCRVHGRLTIWKDLQELRLHAHGTRDVKGLT